MQYLLEIFPLIDKDAEISIKGDIIVLNMISRILVVLGYSVREYNSTPMLVCSNH